MWIQKAFIMKEMNVPGVHTLFITRPGCAGLKETSSWPGRVGSARPGDHWPEWPREVCTLHAQMMPPNRMPFAEPRRHMVSVTACDSALGGHCKVA